MLLQFSEITDIGANRTSQQDSILSIPQLIHNNDSLTDQDYYDDSNASIFAVADGMGGGKSGDLASQLAIAGLSEYVLKHKELLPNDSYSLINSAIYHANEQILSHLNFHPDDLSMGSTVMMGLIQDEKLFIGWVGDSRCYGLDKLGELTQLSHDHSFVQSLVDEGKITQEEAFDHPNRNIINQSLGMPSIIPSFEMFELNSFSKILLCSDGLNSMLTDTEIRNILLKDLPVDQLNQQLVDLANEKGGDDNISSILIHLYPKEKIKNGTSESLVNPIVKPFKRKTTWILTLISICLISLFVLVFKYQTKQSSTLKPAKIEERKQASINDNLNTDNSLPAQTVANQTTNQDTISNSNKSYYIRIKVFSNKKQADALAKTLEGKNDQLNYEVRLSGEGLYEICLLDFKSKDDAMKFLEKSAYPDAVILYKNVVR